MKITRIILPWAFLLILIINSKTQPLSPEEDNTRSTSISPDLILYNANIITMDDQEPAAAAVAITGNIIYAAGSDIDILALQDENTQVIDLEGKTVVPGLIEGHDHLLQQGFFENGPDGLASAAEKMAANGYTTVHQLYSSAGFINTARELAQNGRLAVRINFYLPYNSNCNADVVPWDIFPYTDKKDSTVRVIGVKIFADGGTCGFHPSTTLPILSDNENYGHLFRTQEEMNAIVASVLDAGYPIAMHAIGDSAVGVALNAFENAFAGKGNLLRCRMDHLRVMREDLADKMAALGLAASIQYTWARARLAPSYEGLYQPSVLQWLFPWRRLADRGIPIVAGNDFPYALRIQSMQTLSFLETRRSERSDSLAAWLDGDQLTVAEGLHSMTVSNAWIAFEEDVKGTISAGKLADLTVLSANPLVTDPYDVRFIDVEMTIMDGLIRYQQLNQQHSAIHDAGTFRISVDDRGFWGPDRAGVGLQVDSVEQMFQGSLLMSYDSNTVATATFRQQDYTTTFDGSMQFQEPGSRASEEATVIYEDAATNHPNALRVKQQTFMWNDEPFLLVRYTFENPHDYPVSDLYLGQFMVFNISASNSDWFSYENDNGSWDDNEGLGFAYMYSDDPATPQLGLAMFDDSGQQANNALTFNAGHRLDWGGDELRFASTMRNGIIEAATPGPGSYSVLASAGPYYIEAGESITPFNVAFVEGDNLADLRNAVNLAWQRLDQISAISEESHAVAQAFQLLQNFPNPFNPSTTVRFALPRADNVKIEVFNILGQSVLTLLDEPKKAGSYRIVFDARELGSGLYILTMQAGGFQASRKMLYLK